MTLSRPLLRALLRKVLKSDSDLDAFCGDYFPKVRTRFTNSMDQIAKVTMLLDHAKPVSIVEALQEAHPESVREFESNQQARPASFSELAELDKMRDAAEPPPALGDALPPAPPLQQPAAVPNPSPPTERRAEPRVIITQQPAAVPNPSPHDAIPSLPHVVPAAPGATAAPATQGSVPRRTLLAVTIAGMLVVGISGVLLARILSRPTSDTEQARGVSGPTDAAVSPDNPDATAPTPPAARVASTAKPSPPVAPTSATATATTTGTTVPPARPTNDAGRPPVKPSGGCGCAPGDLMCAVKCSHKK